MIKLANQVIDAYDDVSKEGLKKLAAINPKVVMMSSEELAALKDHDFALSVITKKAAKLNKLPVNTWDNTWLSNQFFEMSHSQLPGGAAKIAAFHIKEACARFKIEPTVAVTAHAAMCKTASTNVYYEGVEPLERKDPITDVSLEKFAAVRDIGDNYTTAQYTFKTAAHVKLASKYFEEKHADIPVEYRHKYAAAIQRRAKELGMPAEGGTVAKYASDHYSGMVDAHIRARASLLECKPEFLATLEKLGAAKKELPPAAFATALFVFDKKAGLNRYYGAHLTDPFLATFGQEPDQYEGWRTKVGNQTLELDEIRRLAIEKHAQIKSYFGGSVADGLRSDPVTIWETLPNDAKEILVGIANGTH